MSTVHLLKLRDFSLVLLFSLLLGACGGSGSSQQTDQNANKAPEKSDNTQKNPTADDAETQSLLIKGSDTAEELVKKLAQAFRASENDVRITVEGGGSGLGITALIDRSADIANASRPIKDREVARAQENGIQPEPFVIAEDGLALIVHADNSVPGLNMQEVSKLYQGQITNWKDVGGPDGEISLYSRGISSGTYVYFRDNAVMGDYAPSVTRKESNEAIVQSVLDDPMGIGYVGLGYALASDGSVKPGLKVLPIASEAGAPMASPMEAENIISGAYPLARPLYHYVNGTPKGMVADFLRFEMSEEARAVIEEVGFYPPTNAHRRQNKVLLNRSM